MLPADPRSHLVHTALLSLVLAGCPDVPPDLTTASDASTAASSTAEASTGSTSASMPTTSTGDGSSETTATTGPVDQGPCRDMGCHYECFDAQDCSIGEADPTPWSCALDTLCTGLATGDDFEPAAFVAGAHCLLQALRDGTPGKIHFSNGFSDGEVGVRGADGFIHILAGRKVVIDMTNLKAGGSSGACWRPQRSKVLDLVAADDASFADCLATDDVGALQTCTGIGNPPPNSPGPGGPPQSPVSFPWLAGTCEASTDACP